ncbi:MAG: phage tail protein [Crocinitomicaceae bacterium]|nr:phage tail protein [Crocinitomicaceae bacterium]
MPHINVNAGFKSVSGLSFSYAPDPHAEGGVSGFTHQLTNRGTHAPLVLSRGFSADRGLYHWCEGTVNTMHTQPCNILISLLDNNNLPVKNWLIFHAIPTKWSVDGFDAGTSGVVMESISLTYRNFIMI